MAATIKRAAAVGAAVDGDAGPSDGDGEFGADGIRRSSGGSGGGDMGRRVSALKVKSMLELLSAEAGFLIDPTVRSALDSLPADERPIAAAENVLSALGVSAEAELQLLLRYFFKDSAPTDA